jgi:hypothetical protein
MNPNLANQVQKLEEAHAAVLAALKAYVEHDAKEGFGGKLRDQAEAALQLASKAVA